MDAPLVLPNEIWEQIFQYSHQSSIIKMMFVNKEFYHLVQPLVWRVLVLCSTYPQDHKRVQQVLDKPALAAFIKDIILAEPSAGHLQPTTGILRRLFSREPNAKRYNDMCLAEFQAIKLARNAIPHFTNIRNIRIAFQSQNPMVMTASYSPYMLLYPTLVDYRAFYSVRSLQLRVHEAQVGYLSQCIHQASPIFGRLEELNLVIGFESGNTYPWKSLPILLFLREPIRYLSYTHDKRGHEPSNPHFPAVSFGYLPNLVRFYQGHAGKGWEFVDPEAWQKFFTQHRKTLKHIILKAVDSESLGFLWPASGQSQNTYPRLETIHISTNIGTRHPKIRPRLPSFTPFADSLTTLSLLGLKLSYEDVQEVVSGLASRAQNPADSNSRSNPTALLQRLRIVVEAETMCPELLDLLYENLKNLRVLDFSYVKSALNEIGSKGTMGDNKDLWASIKSRSYSPWNLRHVDAKNVSAFGHTRLETRNLDFLQVLSEVVPSIRLVGEIDWSDVDGEQYYMDSFLGF